MRALSVHELQSQGKVIPAWNMPSQRNRFSLAETVLIPLEAFSFDQRQF